MRALSIALVLSLSIVSRTQGQEQKKYSFYGPHTFATFAEWLDGQGIEFVIENTTDKEGPLAFFNLLDRNLEVILDSFASAAGIAWHRKEGIVHFVSREKAEVTSAQAEINKIREAMTVQAAQRYLAPMPSQNGMSSLRRSSFPQRAPLNLTLEQKNHYWSKGFVPYSLLTVTQKRLVPNFKGTYIYNSAGVLVAIGKR